MSCRSCDSVVCDYNNISTNHCSVFADNKQYRKALNILTCILCYVSMCLMSLTTVKSVLIESY